MSQKYPGLPGSDFAEFGLVRSLNYQMWRAQADQNPQEFILASNLAATGAQPPVTIGPRRHHTVEVTGTFSATLEIYGSVPGSQTFVPLTPYAVVSGTASGSSITAPGVYLFQGTFDRLYVNVSAYTSGTVENVRAVSVA